LKDLLKALGSQFHHFPKQIFFELLIKNIWHFSLFFAFLSPMQTGNTDNRLQNKSKSIQCKNFACLPLIFLNFLIL